MSISSYTELKASVVGWLHRSDLSSVAGDFIALGEWKINRMLRVSAMEADLSVVIAAGVAALPADYVSMKFAYIDGTPVQVLSRKTAEQVIRMFPTRSSNDKPIAYARQGTNLVFGPYPNSAYTVKGVYYKRLPPLADSNLTNYFTASAPDLLLYAALMEAAPYMKGDERIPVWQAKFTEALGQVQGETDREEISGGPLVAVTA